MPAPSHCDPSRGVFETLLVVEGRPLELGRHLERISGSVETLYGQRLPAGAANLAWETAGGIPLGRLRLVATPGKEAAPIVGASADAVDPSRVFPGSTRGAELWSFQVEGGFGAHKWVDRRLLERAEAEAPAGATPLIVDGEDALEASRANLFAVAEGALLSPPADGRIVPGITRRRVLELAAAAGHAVREEVLSLKRLQAADEVFLTNSVRGVERVEAIDGEPLPGAGPLSEGIAAELRRSWLGRAAPSAVAATAP